LPNGKEPEPGIWVDTGTRLDDELTLVREGADGRNKFAWKVPVERYI